MIRKHKKFSRPKKSFDIKRIKSENEILKRYGLKNKKEIWKAKGKLDIIRNQAKGLIDADPEKQEIFLNKLRKRGFKVNNPAEVLALTEEDILKRRLQTFVYEKGLTTTPKSARQLITHKKIKVGNQIVNIPSYEVYVNDEKDIKITEKSIKKPKVEEKDEIDTMDEIEKDKVEEVEVKNNG